MTVTREQFRQAMHRHPENDDLDRCNCPNAGEPGHFMCGWCVKCDQPRFSCSCMMETHAAGSFEPEVHPSSRDALIPNFDVRQGEFRDSLTILFEDAVSDILRVRLFDAANLSQFLNDMNVRGLASAVKTTLSMKMEALAHAGLLHRHPVDGRWMCDPMGREMAGDQIDARKALLKERVRAKKEGPDE